MKKQVLFTRLRWPSWSMSAWAHHGDAGRYDEKLVTLDGTVVELQMINPHAIIVIDVKNADGKVMRWQAEGGGPGALAREGWTNNTLKPGDKITLIGRRVKSGAPYMNLTERAVVYRTDTKRLLFRTGQLRTASGRDRAQRSAAARWWRNAQSACSRASRYTRRRSLLTGDRKPSRDKDRASLLLRLQAASEVGKQIVILGVAGHQAGRSRRRDLKMRRFVTNPNALVLVVGLLSFRPVLRDAAVAGCSPSRKRDRLRRRQTHCRRWQRTHRERRLHR